MTINLNSSRGRNAEGFGSPFFGLRIVFNTSGENNSLRRRIYGAEVKKADVVIVGSCPDVENMKNENKTVT